MNPAELELVVFDLAGTTVEDRGEVPFAFTAALAEHVRAIPSATAVFGLLRVRGVRIALNTGFDRETTELLLGALGRTDGIVDAVVCGDDVTQGRPAPYLIFRAMEAAGAGNVHKVANVGDTTLDLLAGYNAGVGWNVGVLSRAHNRQSLEGVELPGLWIAA